MIHMKKNMIISVKDRWMKNYFPFKNLYKVNTNNKLCKITRPLKNNK